MDIYTLTWLSWISLILGAIGTLGAIAQLLGFIFGIDIWARREKVGIQDAYLIAKATGHPFEEGDQGRLSIHVRFRMVKQSGEKASYVKAIMLRLDKGLHKKLKMYFDIPDRIITTELEPPVELNIGRGEKFSINRDYEISMQDTANLTETNIRDIKVYANNLSKKYWLNWQRDDGRKKRWKKFRQ
jgi:hypothetical protein